MKDDGIRYLSFTLGAELFSVAITAVQEVVEWEKLQKAPLTPEFVLGVFNYHGRVIPVVDIAPFFGERTAAEGADTRIIVLAGDDLSLAFKVDRTLKIDNFSREELQEGMESAPEKGFIKAVVNHEGKLYNIIEIEKLVEEIEDRFMVQSQRS